MKNVIEIIGEKEGLYKLKGADKSEIKNAENRLGVRFAKDYREYTSEYGAISYYGHELTGVCSAKPLNVVVVTEEERENDPEVKQSWYVIEQTHYDDIVIWQDPDGNVHMKQPGCKAKKIASSLAEYIERKE